MMTLQLGAPGDRLSILCLGAHSDDIEIGGGGTLLTWLGRGLKLDVLWCVLSADGDREAEARASARDFLTGAASAQVEVMKFKTSFFPTQGDEIKTWFESLKSRIKPGVILTHRRDDLGC
jgi:LmbE family N-acetylglucosaminyl deacetylase